MQKPQAVCNSHTMELKLSQMERNGRELGNFQLLITTKDCHLLTVFVRWMDFLKHFLLHRKDYIIAKLLQYMEQNKKFTIIAITQVFLDLQLM